MKTARTGISGDGAAGIPDQPAGASAALHLVRHGQSTWNVLGLVQGQTDLAELTDLGRSQAEQAAELLENLPVARLLTSDLKRARQTAEIIGRRIALAPIPTKLLREQSLGSVEGRRSEDAIREWERVSEESLDEYGDPLPTADLRLGGGESMRDVLARVGALLATPWVTDAAADIVIVTHGDTIRILLGHLLGDDPDAPAWRDVDNGEVQTVYRDRSGVVAHVRRRLDPR